ncbi:DNA-binding transcriptional regulator, LysR family [Monaibacterium marinum]|uniref:DNA-binding transcriptional regulator, LysR family n=1 Tax=Pontivivens marinum TaxID=1690039 RepID=A0A2C9CUS2_9RHOB|nr:LysR family transcriptional regulator [Monaibacterium marinum]SOH94960.1 DNA-binding transcriptional regulator, LysR family [Monaibacterium marinum]
MNLRALETLVQILTVPSFSAVAQIRNMTLSAVSMQMKALEAELGVELFDRQSRPPRLTPLGRQVALQSRGILEARDTVTTLCQRGEKLVGQFLIGFIQTASVRILPGFLEAARREAAGASFQFSAGLSETLSDFVAEGRLDAAVVTQVDPMPAHLCVQRLATEEMVMALPATHADADQVQLEAQLPFIRFRPSTGIGRLISASLSQVSAQPQQIILDSIEGTLECVKRGLGYTVLPRPDVERYCDAQMVIRTVSDLYPSRDLVLVTRNDRQSDGWRDALFSLMVTQE